MKIRFHVWTVSQDRRTPEQIEQHERLEEKRRAARVQMANRALDRLAVSGAAVIRILNRRQAG